jgi:cysteine desulfurase
LWSGLKTKIPYVYLNGPEITETAPSKPESRLPNTLNISFEFIEGESILLNLDLKGIACSTGSACTSGSLEPSHVLLAMGVDTVRSQGSVRFSLGKDNTDKEINYVIEVLPEIIEKLRAMSPLYEQFVKEKK